MKKLLLLLVIALPLVLASCSNSKDDEPSLTTYTFNYEFEGSSLLTTNVILFEYSSEGEKVANTSIDCYKGLSQEITANDKSEKVKVYVKMQSGGTTTNRWIQQVFYLKKGNNTNITLNGETIIGTKEP